MTPGSKRFSLVVAVCLLGLGATAAVLAQTGKEPKDETPSVECDGGFAIHDSYFLASSARDTGDEGPLPQSPEEAARRYLENAPGTKAENPPMSEFIVVSGEENFAQAKLWDSVRLAHPRAKDDGNYDAALVLVRLEDTWGVESAHVCEEAIKQW